MPFGAATLILLWLLAASGSPTADVAGPPSVYFLGNGLLETVEQHLPQVVQDRLGFTPTIAGHFKKGATLAYHADMHPFWSATWSPTNSFNANCQYHSVVLQEQSTLGALPDQSPVAHALGPQYTREASLQALRRFYAPGAKTCGTQLAVLQAWALQDAGGQYPLKVCDGVTWPDFAALTDALLVGARSYAQVLNDAGVAAKVVPLGQAFRAVHDADPALFARLYLGDRKHLGPLGHYLAAQTLFAALYQRRPAALVVVDGMWRPREVTLPEAQALACLACTAVHCGSAAECGCGLCGHAGEGGGAPPLPSRTVAISKE
eukprot:CAMPEP_0174310748 /NCGR_PEP_ID=MMETSP0810-20121108/3247_1 /TAXON_ID=73025 ORGANISM="Eutreptiella gymnastica-like, Strain CCMP1594" /NCGR_SAMPLE_ID=MMETSP0810 /ASSEMBLY_ACC=CAM_ASM_000659 /LENGTH=318 /DNA_ID=CAMNT_0015418745 /DNA_START=14 /DNA_END=970 /DNA_ORIENTATION=+